MMRIGKFTDFYRDVTKEGTKIPQEKYLQYGRYPVIDQGRQAIAGRWDSDDGIFEEVPAIVFGDHTRAIKYIEEPFFIGADGVKILRPVNSQDNPKYLYYALQAARIPDLGYSRHFKAVKALEIRIYSTEEQNEIVRVLEKIDHLIEQRHEEVSFLDQLVKSRFIELFGTIHDNKFRFDIVTLQDVSAPIKDGTHKTPTYTDDTKNGYKFLSSKDVTTGKINWSHLKYIPEELHQELYARIAPRKGDILLAKNGTTGIAAVVDRDEVFDIYVSLALIRPIGIHTTYLWAAINAAETKQQFDASLKGIGVPNLHLGEIKKARIILPPMALQEQFASFVEQTDKSKLAVQQGLQELEILKKSLMQQYFG